jgi:type II restriction enzyme
MEFGFREPQAAYNSGSQNARAWTEQWVSEWLYCPNCGHNRLSQFPPNVPVADFFCGACNDQFGLKSGKKPFGAKLANGAYGKKIERLTSSTNPNFFLLKYNLSERSVETVCVIPKHFFSPAIVEKRAPLSPSARRAGWIGSNILLDRIPEAGRIYVVRDGRPIEKEKVVDSWQKTLFLRNADISTRGWLLNVMNCVEQLGRQEFGIEDAYSFEAYLSTIYSGNSNVRPKIRQQLQVLRDHGYLDFIGRGRYRLRRASA